MFQVYARVIALLAPEKALAILLVIANLVLAGIMLVEPWLHGHVIDALVARSGHEAWFYIAQGRTTFVIAHRLTTVREADQILVLKEGRLVERGTFDELLALRGLFAELNDQGTFAADDETETQHA